MEIFEVIERLKNGPSFLFLGQDYLRYGNEKDPFLWSLNKHFFSESNTCENYNILLNIKDKSEIEPALIWMQNRSDKIAAPEWIEKIAQVAWSGVFTSSIDTILERTFRNNWREIHPVFNSEYYPKDYKSKTRMHITYAFGNVSQESTNQRPPLDIFEFEVAKQNSTKLLNRINREFITPYGILVIDGYNPLNDWVKIRDLYPIINSLNINQTFLFGIDLKIINDPYIDKLIKEEKLVVFDKHLVDYISIAQQNGTINFDEFKLTDFSDQKRLTINRKVVGIPKEIYNQISNNAIVLDDRILLPREELDKLQCIEAFREFLSRSSIGPVWDGYKNEFNVKREYEAKIEENISKALNAEFFYDTIIVHGQTGTGKTVSMGSVAYNLKLGKKYPVIFITRNNERPSFDSIDSFCKWLEDNGAHKTVIFWDDSVYNNSIQQYFELNNYLISRGRKVVVIGSAYKLNNDVMKKYVAKYIEAPLKLETSELKAFHNIFNKYSGRQEKLESIWNNEYDNNFLVALYRLLPATKYSIKKGVLSEVNINELTFGDLLKINYNKQMTAIEQAFINAGVNIDGCESDYFLDLDIEKVVEIVSVSGQFGLGIPLEIVLRIFNDNISSEVAKIMDKLDFFRVVENSNGDINVFPRHRLEAKIVAASKIATTQKQVELILELINNVNGNSYTNSNEIDFLVELLKSIGPNNEEQSFRYSKYYKEISDKLENLRKDRGVFNQRTILQETTYLREYVKNSEFDDINEKYKLLKKAELILKEEIDVQENGKKKGRQIGHLFIEISSNIGAQLLFMINDNKDKNLVIEKFNELQYYLKKSQIYSSDSYYPVDIWAWTTIALLNYNFTAEEKNDLIATILNVFDKSQMENPDIKLREDFNDRLLQIADLTDRQELSDESFKNLLDMGSASGIYIRVKNKLKGIELNKPISRSDKQTCIEAIQYMENYSECVYKDEKCLNLLLKLKWITNSNEPLFYGEKRKLPFSAELWEEILSILNTIIDLNNDEVTSQIKYLKAISLFHIGSFNECFEMFSEIRDNYYIGARRIIISYIATNDDGKPKTFNGQLIGIDDNRANMYIKDFRRSIPYFNKDFVQKNPLLHATYDDLIIGFNFLGLQVASIGKMGGIIDVVY